MQEHVRKRMKPHEATGVSVTIATSIGPRCPAIIRLGVRLRDVRDVRTKVSFFEQKEVVPLGGLASDL